MSSRNSSNIVVEWLRSLHLGQYAESFLDNGYDDLEICKQVGDPDLDAIGVFNPSHRHRLLQSVRTLREEGAASVYFTLEETTAIHDECACDSSSSRTESSISKHEDKEARVSSRNSSRSEGSCKDKFRDEYEEGKAELVKIPRLQLKHLLKEKLTQDGIRLSNQPYSTSTGERGYLEGLASRYADLFNTHYGDVLEHLEELRRREWEELSPRIRILHSSTTPSTPPGTYSPTQLTSVSVHGSSLTTSQSQPIYVPGKYSPSSCLSDKEEDEIYGFAGYGVYGKQMLQRQQQRMILQAQSQAQNYQTCLSPRSAYFYEFPPTEQTGSQTCKKKTSFSKFLRGLKTVHRKEKHGGCSPRHCRDRQYATANNSRVGTPDSLLDGPPMLPTPAMDPRMINYDKLRVLQMNGSPSNFEETIHRLKIQDALKKKEKFHREHEEILRDIRQGLLQLGREAARGSDDTYMYDDEISAMTSLGGGGHHWYDEPPYESDPEDFLMGINSPQPSAIIQNGRVCFTLNLRPESQREAVFSHPSAGDISLPREKGKKSGAPRRGLILPQSGPYPPTIIPLTHARSCRESGDYAGSDVQSLSSRLSTVSVETSRSEQYLQLPSRTRTSSAHSSDYEDQELPSPRTIDPRSKLKDEGVRNGVMIRSTSSAESLPSGSGSSTQALVREASGHSSLSAGDDCESSIPPGPAPQGGNIPVGPVIGKARALVDCIPSPYDKEALKFKKGDIVDITQMNQSGLWQGVCHGRTGLFKFINVELLNEKATKRLRHQNKHPRRGKPKTVEELLKRINMEEHTSVFVLNGYEDVELFQDLESQDLDYLGIRDPEHRAKILTAVQLLHDYDSPDECEVPNSSSSAESVGSSSKSSKTLSRETSSMKNLRDSGCYDSHSVDEQHVKRRGRMQEISNNLDSKQSTRRLFQTLHSKSVSSRHHDNGEAVEMEILNNHKLAYHPNIPVSKSSAKEFLEQTREVLDRAREVSNSSREILERAAHDEKKSEDSCETNAKLSTVKYVVGSYDLSANGDGSNTEKSSDSGISSSSLSSTNIRVKAVALESPKQSRLFNQNSPTCDSKSKVGQILDKLESQNNPFLSNGTNFRPSEESSRKNPTSPTRSYPFQNKTTPGLIVQKKN